MDTQYQLQQEAELSFRQLNGEDLPALYDIELASFNHPWTMEAYRKELEENPLALYWGCFSQQQLLAFAGLWQILDEGHITNIAVAPQYRRRGIGEWLLRRVAVELQARNGIALTLEVRSHNQAAIALYEKLGFRNAGRRKGYYDDPPDDALIMWWNLLETEGRQYGQDTGY